MKFNWCNKMVKIWKISPWFKAEAWQEFVDNKYMQVGNFKMDGLEDLSQFDEIDDVLGYLEENDIVPKKGLNQLWKFYTEIKIDDIVIAYGDKTILGIGRINGDYDYETYGNHTREVDWRVFNPPIDVQNDLYLYGDPPNRYGVLNKQLAIIQLKISAWEYLLAKYYKIGKAFLDLYF